MSFQRRKSSGGVDVTGLDDVAERYSSKKKAASAAVDGSLDLTALTTIRRKSKSSSSMTSDIQEINGLAALTASNSDLTKASSTGNMKSSSVHPLRQNSNEISQHNELSRNNSTTSAQSTPTPRRRGSRSGSISGLTAEQAIKLSTQYATDLTTTHSSDGDGNTLTPTSNSPNSRRGSFNGTVGTGSISNVSFAADLASLSLQRRGSFNGGVKSIGGTPRLSRQNSFNGSGSDNEGGCNEISGSGNKLSEKRIISLASNAMSKYKGRSISSIKKSPKYGVKYASTERGITLISNHIALGGRDDASDINSLKTYGITHILNMAAQLPNYMDCHNNYICMKIPLHDSEDCNIVRNLLYVDATP